MSETRLRRFRLSPPAVGALYCSISVLGYGTANACMTKLSKLGCENTWALCNKEAVTVFIVGPWLTWQVWRRKMEFPTGRPLLILIAAGLATELIGNIGIQWGYRVVGLAVMIPANTGFVLVASAVLGWLVLGERVSLRNMAVIALLLFALVLLGYGTMQTAEVNVEKAPLSFRQIATAIGVASLCGTAFTFLSVALRYCVDGRTSLSAAVVIITGIGVVTLGPISVWQVGAAQLIATPVEQFALMYTAGVCNFLAFLALVRGLQLTTVMHVNMITNAGQVSLALIAGILLFGEASNHWLVLSVILMIVGIFAFGAPIDREAFDAHV